MGRFVRGVAIEGHPGARQRQMEEVANRLVYESWNARRIFLFPNNLNTLWTGNKEIGFVFSEGGMQGLPVSFTDSMLRYKTEFINEGFVYADPESGPVAVQYDPEIDGGLDNKSNATS